MSSKEDIVEGNKLIAEFMELKGFEDSRYGWMWLNPVSDGVHDKETFSLKYNTSWDWLMQVVDKIESLAYMHCVEKLNEIQHRSFFNESKMVNEVVNGARSEKKLEAVWLSVIDFIKWHKMATDAIFGKNETRIIE